MNGAQWLPVGQPCYHLSTRLCSQQDRSFITLDNPCVDVTGGMERWKMGKPRTEIVDIHLYIIKILLYSSNSTIFMLEFFLEKHVLLWNYYGTEAKQRI